LSHWFEQQSLGRVHAPPAAVQIEIEHAPCASAVGPQPFEQHAPAKEQLPPSPTHPVVGRQVSAPAVSSAQSRLQHAFDVEQLSPMARPPHPVSSPVGASPLPTPSSDASASEDPSRSPAGGSRTWSVESPHPAT
jgi:hypothetical protein